jgi:choice-of-anchor C domain-containing protein
MFPRPSPTVRAVNALRAAARRLGRQLRLGHLSASVVTLVAVGIVLRLAFAAGPTAFQNGSFETVSINIGSWATLTSSSNSTAITGWTVSQGAIDIVSSQQWAPTDGNNSVDLGGYSSGSQTGATFGGISQTFLTIAGQPYTVLFDMGGNGGNTPTTKRMTVSAAGTSANYSLNMAGYSLPNMNWQYNQSFTFTATSTSTTLSFVSPDQTTAGMVIDNVRVLTTIAGTVFEDANYGGGAGRDKTTALAAGGTARSGARVEL